MTVEQSLGIVGKHLMYTYENGWSYETYIKNDTTLDYRVLTGLVAGRWVKDQKVNLQQLTGQDHYKMDWEEPTGTCVSLTLDLRARRVNGSIFFPQWIYREPQKTVCFQNEHLEEMRSYREAGPISPIVIVATSANIYFMEDCGPDNDSVISCSPSELPAGYIDRCK